MVAHADVTYASGATLDGSVVCTNNFSSVVSVNAILSGYDSSGSGFVGGGFSDPIPAVFPQLTTAAQHLLLPADRQHLRQLSGITLSPGGVETHHRALHSTIRVGPGSCNVLLSPVVAGGARAGTARAAVVPHVRTPACAAAATSAILRIPCCPRSARCRFEALSSPR